MFRITGNAVATRRAAGNEVFSVDACHLATTAYVDKRKLRVVFHSGVCSASGCAKVISVQRYD